MEKLNDTMTICTLARPDTITIAATEYKDMCHAQQHYEQFIEMLNMAMTLDRNGNPDIDFNGRDFILNAYRFLEPNAFRYRVMQLKHDTPAGEED